MDAFYSVAEAEKYDPKNPPRVMGAVFGHQKEQAVEVMSSVELPFKYDEEKQLRIDEDAFAEDTELCEFPPPLGWRSNLRVNKKNTDKQIYPEHELLGWYATSETLEPTDLEFHKRVSVCLSTYSSQRAPFFDFSLLPSPQFAFYTESPFFMRMKPIPKRSDKALPVTVYQVWLSLP